MAEAKKEGIVGRIITVIVKATGYASAAFLFGLMALIFYDVVCRYFFNRPVLGGTELVEFFMAITISLSFGYGQYLKRHVFVELFYQHLKGRAKAAVDIIIHLLCFGIYALIAWSAFQQAMYLQIAGLTSTVLLIPAWPFRVVLAFGAAIYCLALVRDLIKAVRQLVLNEQTEEESGVEFNTMS